MNGRQFVASVLDDAIARFFFKIEDYEKHSTRHGVSKEKPVLDPRDGSRWKLQHLLEEEHDQSAVVMLKICVDLERKNGGWENNFKGRSGEQVLEIAKKRFPGAELTSEGGVIDIPFQGYETFRECLDLFEELLHE